MKSTCMQSIVLKSHYLLKQTNGEGIAVSIHYETEQGVKQINFIWTHFYYSSKNIFKELKKYSAATDAASTLLRFFQVLSLFPVASVL